MAFTFGITVDVNTKKAENEILKEAVKQINNNMFKKLKNIDKLVGDGFIERVRETPEYKSITSDKGQLRLEFGIENPNYVMSRILSKLKFCFSTEYKKAKIQQGKVVGEFRVKFNKPDFSFLYEEASFRTFFAKLFKRRIPSSFKTKKNAKIDWLRWLLERGTDNIVYGYSVRFGEVEASRTGHAIMIHTGNWGVPSVYAGTSSNNWLTRTLKIYERDVTIIVDNIIREGIKNVG